ncbi:uncharacterized protein LOC130803329 [Amaranthus tricolor]|uniref:uncharacterized protein LOC130803329 n=1 Tax=Amaranthus tricolor TaxID=29722 RepID=UPI002582F82E|nr:uncharacterized protein LOC130803329 [Amaranthus tricolor]
MFIHRQHTTFEVFLTIVYDVIGCDRNSYELKMEMKYSVTEKNVLFPVMNDESISALAYAASQALRTAIKVCIELVLKLGNAREVMCSMKLPESGPSVRHDTFTEMLTNPSYVNEHIDEFTSPTHLHSQNANEVDSLNQEDEHIDSDPEEDDEKREALDATIRDSAPFQDWLRFDEVDQRLIDARMTYNNDNSMTENGDFRVGQEFNSLDHLKKIVKPCAISNSRNFRVNESEPTKYVIQCINAEEKSCEWRM